MSQLVPSLNFGLEDSQLAEDYSDFFYNYEITADKGKMYLNLEGLQSGVPTRTTPTLTPTTLRSIEQTFINELATKQESHENEAGFVPPQIHPTEYQFLSSELDRSKSSSYWPSSISQSSSDCDTRSPPPPATFLPKGANKSPQTHQRRNMGGRKPAKDVNMSPEEEERRRIRRERNKAAAARCRKRRVDHTNALIKETEELEQKRQCLQDELASLQAEKEELEIVLNNHKRSSNCRYQTQSPPDVKPFRQQAVPQLQPFNPAMDRVKTEYLDQNMQHMDDIFVLPISPNKKLMLSSTVPISKPSRPNSLNIAAMAPQSKNNVTEMAGVPLSTPSTGLSFNYESLMVGGTGLTPVSAPLVPSCSTQQRNIPVRCDMISLKYKA